MIKVLGVKRLAGILILLALNAVVAAAVFMYFIPNKQKVERDLRSTKANVASKRAEITRIKDEFTRINKQKLLFEDLQTLGFFGDQDRFATQRRIEAINELTDVLNARYEIREAKTEENDMTKKAGQLILDTPISINVEALDDVDFYKFIYWVEYGFSGHTNITSLSMERVTDVNDATLRMVGSENPKPMIKGSFEFDWRTLIPKEDMEKLEGGVE